MKKSMIFMACLALAGGLSAQRATTHNMGDKTNFRPAEMMAAKNNYTLRMSHFESNDNYERTGYSYDENHRLVAIHDFFRGEYDVIDSIKYDAQGHLTHLAGWQLLNGTRKNVYKVDYGYDAQGRITSRTNYNFFSGDWQLGGIYDYRYNADGLISHTELTMADEVFQIVDYYYQDGKLVREKWQNRDMWSGNGFIDDEVVHYYYENGKLTEAHDSIYSDGFWELEYLYTYAYDANGNMTEYHKYNGGTLETERRVYEYDSRLLETTLIPYTPEIATRPDVYTNHNLYIRESYWMADVDHVLQYLCDYNYFYKDYNAVSVNEVEKPTFVMYPNPASHTVTLEGINAETQVHIYDAMGRQVYAQTVNQGDAFINVSNFAKGVYVVRLSDGRSSQLVVR